MLLRKSASGVTSRSVPSAYLARTTICCVAPLPSRTAVPGIQFEPTAVGDGRRIVRRPGFEPAERSSDVVRSSVVEALAAGVRHLAGGLFEDQALGRQGQVDAAAVDLAGQPIVIAVRIEAEQRQAEAVLAAGRPVAAADVAAGLA